MPYFVKDTKKGRNFDNHPYTLFSSSHLLEYLPTLKDKRAVLMPGTGEGSAQKEDSPEDISEGSLRQLGQARSSRTN